ncbi:hypothetical protein SBF1_1540008 [Candidatus Desulfosporosinus infrequens]|uniref:Uncharacterized protein n=1 Tax=Candidatus Desulfosporosinus infrequens TaxID=2043169 RepID=A0A2U3K7T8_9FIRM|nr:hypothetical protein SBF1_1540008 [Candidatus Desulfosporosinus infrequens]
MALMLVVAALSGEEKIIEKALRIVDYHLRRNYCAYKSHSSKKLNSSLTN